jgi:hypothetical protein
MEKLFLLNCKKCKWFERSTGLTKDLEHLTEIKKCKKCGSVRKFKCPKCGQIVKMFRMKTLKKKQN